MITTLFSHRAGISFLMLAVLSILWGCASKTPPPAGFISDYSKLEDVKDGHMRYVSPKLKAYTTFMIDPVEIQVKREVLDPEKRAEVARYMHDSMENVLREGGYALTDDAGVGVARVCVAITDIQESKWYLNLHPASKLTGAGRGGASMEAEVIDSVTGEQLAAAIRTGKSKQFELNPFANVGDIKAVIDKWAKAAAERLKEMREAQEDE
jgi:hypothetical protein